jgi:predicted helicase
MTKAKIYYARVDDDWTKREKLGYLEKLEHISNVEWQELTPDKKHTWLTEGLEDEFDTFVEIANKGIKANRKLETIFEVCSNGVKTNRDRWVYNFDSQQLIHNVRLHIETYNQEVARWQQVKDKNYNIDDFVLYDDLRISWSRDLKADLKRNRYAEFLERKVRLSTYRPFTFSYLFFDPILNQDIFNNPIIFPNIETEKENQLIWFKVGSEVPTFALMANHICDLLPQGGSQCFPFYTYDKDGNNRKENITDWSLDQFQTQYKDPKITKWDIFHYTYALLHHPHYRDRYAANLKRELPRIPFAPEFHPFAKAGKRLTEIHINYEQQPEYRLKHIENKDLPIDWRVKKMRLSKDKTQIKYNDFLTLTGIPLEALEYRLGNRSALDWIIDQYQVSTDKRSGITNDPNRLDDEEYIVRLIKQVITVSLETVEIVKSLPDLGLPKD